ncbi:histidine kinase [Desulfobacter sp.]|uniref:histidine kinase n=1 Tax=Desulfobacter sp. TaxID=2294 RepID=UPI003D106A0D
MAAEIRYLNANQEALARSGQLRALAGKLTMAEQAERRRVAKVLHDGIQQYMAAAKLHLSGLERQIKDPKLSQAAKKIEETIGTCIQMARSLSADLSPPALYRGGTGLRFKVACRPDAGTPSFSGGFYITDVQCAAFRRYCAAGV